MRRVQVTVVAHRSIAHELGLLEPWLDELTAGRITRHVRDDGPLTTATGDLLVVLGSPTSVANGWCAPPAEAEIAAVRDWVAGGRPYLGICFGAQVLARALGGTVHRMATTFRSYERLSVADDAPEAVGGPWVVWHEDAITAPTAARVMTFAPHADLTFRHGRAWGLQPHVEVTAETLDRMLAALGVAPGERAPILDALAAEEASTITPATRLASMLDAFTADAFAPTPNRIPIER